MSHCLARRNVLSVLASFLFCCGCESSIFERSPARSHSETNDEWQSYGSYGANGSGILLIAINPADSGDSATFEPCIATAHTALYPMDVRVCSVGPPLGIVKLWGQSDTPELLSTLVPSGAYALRFTPDGRGVVYACNHELIVWHTDDRRFETRLSASHETRFELSSDCRWIAQIDEENEKTKVAVLDFETVKPRGSVVVQSSRRPACHISSDGCRLSMVVHSWESKATTAVVFNVETGTQERVVPIDYGSWHTAWSASGKTLAAVNSTDDIVQIWDIEKGELRCTAGKQSKIWCVAITPDERLVITGGEGERNGKAAGEVVIWDARTGRELGRHWDESSWGVTALAVAEKRRLLIGSGDGYVAIRKIPDRILAQTLH